MTTSQRKNVFVWLFLLDPESNGNCFVWLFLLDPDRIDSFLLLFFWLFLLHPDCDDNCFCLAVSV